MAFLMLILLVVPQIGATEDADVQFVEGLVQFLNNPPKDKKGLTAQVVDDFKTGNTDQLKALIQGTPNALVGHLVKALVDGNAEADADRLMAHLESNEATYLKFLTQAHEQMTKDPARLERMQNSLNQVRAILLTNRITPPPFNDRIIQSTIVVVGMGQWLYGIYSPLDRLSPMMEVGTQYFPHVMSIYVGLAVFNDFRAFKRAWRDYFNKVRERRRTRANLKALTRILNALKKSPEVGLAAETYGYFAGRAEQAAPDAMTEVTARWLAEIERLKLEPQAWAEAEAFSRSRTYFALVKDLGKSLTEHEKQLLNQRHSEKGLPIPFELQAKVLNYETQVLSAFDRWMNGRGVKSQHSDRLNEALAKESFAREMNLANLTPRNSFYYLTTILGFGVGMMGLDATLAANAGQLVAYDYIMHVKDFMQTHHDTIYKTFSYAVLAGFAGMTWETFWYKNEVTAFDNKKVPKVDGHLNPLIKLLSRWKRLGRVQETSCEDLLK